MVGLLNDSFNKINSSFFITFPVFNILKYIPLLVEFQNCLITEGSLNRIPNLLQGCLGFVTSIIASPN